MEGGWRVFLKRWKEGGEEEGVEEEKELGERVVEVIF